MAGVMGEFVTKPFRDELREWAPRVSTAETGVGGGILAPSAGDGSDFVLVLIVREEVEGWVEPVGNTLY